MPPDKQIECRISWDDILLSYNPENLIFRELQQKDIDAYTNNGRFESTKGFLHLIDDTTTRERVYVWCPDREAFPLCKCLMCEDRRTMTRYTLDFNCQLMFELHDCGAATSGQVHCERNRVAAIIDREREIAERQRQDREREERRARDQELQQQLAQEARERRLEMQRIQGLAKQQRKQAKKQEETIVIRVQNEPQVR